LSSLENMVSSIRFTREPTYIYVLPGIFLAISIPALIAISFTAALQGIEKALASWYRLLAPLYAGYWLSSSYLAYRSTRLVAKHLVDSGITSYYWLKRKGDVDAVKALYRGALLRKTLPSPTTSLLLAIVTGGLAYPIILHIIEKTIRDHCHGEEAVFLGRPGTMRIGVERGLLDISASVLTLGLYLVYWCLRFVKTYNNHVKIIHGNHPEPPSSVTTYKEALPSFSTLALSMVFLSAGIYGLLGLYGLPSYPMTALGYGLLLASYAVSQRRGSMYSQALRIFVFIYLVFISATLVGFIGSPAYLQLAGETQKYMQAIMSRDPVTLTINIFLNNYALSLISLAPLVGSLYIGMGLTNAGVFYGVALLTSIAKGDYSALTLLLMPHAILELFGYALFTTISTRVVYMGARSLAKAVILGSLVLLLASVVESATILILT